MLKFATSSDRLLNEPMFAINAPWYGNTSLSHWQCRSRCLSSSLQAIYTKVIHEQLTEGEIWGKIFLLALFLNSSRGSCGNFCRFVCRYFLSFLNFDLKTKQNLLGEHFKELSSYWTGQREYSKRWIQEGLFSRVDTCEIQIYFHFYNLYKFHFYNLYKWNTILQYCSQVLSPL